MISCDDLEEHTGPHSEMYYVWSGWDEFMAQDYDQAKEFFLATLLVDEGSESNYSAYAYSGLGWTAIYKANVNLGIDNRTLREDLRDSSIYYFESALTIIMDTLIIEEDTTIVEKIEDDDDLEMYANVLAGVVFNTSYLAIDKAMEFYSDGSDSLAWNEALNYSQLVISSSDSLLSTFADYDFKYDENINVEDIRLLRAHTYIRLSKFENAAIEIYLIPSLDCDLSQISVVECLYSSGLNP